MFLLSHNVPSQCYFQFLSHFFFVVCKCFQFGPVENVSPFPQCSFPMLFSVFESLFFFSFPTVSSANAFNLDQSKMFLLSHSVPSQCYFQFLSRFFFVVCKCFQFGPVEIFLLSHNVPSQCYFQFLSHFFFVVCKCFQFGPVENVSPFPQCSFPMLFSVFESLFFCRLQMLSIWTSRKCFSFPTMFLPNAIF